MFLLIKKYARKIKRSVFSEWMDLGEPNDDWSLYGIFQNLKFKLRGVPKVVEVEKPLPEPIPAAEEVPPQKSTMDIELEDDQSESSQPQQFEPVNPIGALAGSPKPNSGGRSPGVNSSKSHLEVAQEGEVAKEDEEIATLGKRNLEVIDELDPTALEQSDPTPAEMDPTQLEVRATTEAEQLEKQSDK